MGKHESGPLVKRLCAGEWWSPRPEPDWVSRRGIMHSQQHRSGSERHHSMTCAVKGCRGTALRSCRQPTSTSRAGGATTGGSRRSTPVIRRCIAIALTAVGYSATKGIHPCSPIAVIDRGAHARILVLACQHIHQPSPAPLIAPPSSAASTNRATTSAMQLPHEDMYLCHTGRATQLCRPTSLPCQPMAFAAS